MGTANTGNQGQGNRDDQKGKKPGYEASGWKDPKNPGATESGGRAEGNRNLGSDPESNRDRDQRNLSADRNRDVSDTSENAVEGRGRFNEENKSTQDMSRGARDESQDIQDSSRNYKKDQNLSDRSNFDADEEV